MWCSGIVVPSDPAITTKRERETEKKKHLDGVSEQHRHEMISFSEAVSPR